MYLYQTNVLEMDKKPRNIKAKEQFQSKAIKIHGDKYEYDNCEYINNETKVQITCKVHGIFEQIPKSHLKGSGCSKCSYAINQQKRQKTPQQFIEQAIQIHGNKYEYDTCNYINTYTKVQIMCKIHGIFGQTPANHLSGFGCLQCGYSVAQQKNTNTLQQFIKQAIQIHGDRYEYDDCDYVNAFTKVQIQCKIHGIFEQTPTNHLSGSGCILCKNKTEGILKIFLQETYFEQKITAQQTFDWLYYQKQQKLDLYIQDYNIAIELMGPQHFKYIPHFHNDLKQEQNRDLNKELLLQQHNIPIIYIDQQDVWNNKNNWQKKLIDSIDIIKNRDQSIWIKICIGTVYNKQ